MQWSTIQGEVSAEYLRVSSDLSKPPLQIALEFESAEPFRIAAPIQPFRDGLVDVPLTESGEGQIERQRKQETDEQAAEEEEEEEAGCSEIDVQPPKLFVSLHAYVQSFFGKTKEKEKEKEKEASVLACLRETKQDTKKVLQGIYDKIYWLCSQLLAAAVVLSVSSSPEAQKKQARGETQPPATSIPELEWEDGFKTTLENLVSLFSFYDNLAHFFPDATLKALLAQQGAKVEEILKQLKHCQASIDWKSLVMQLGDTDRHEMTSQLSAFCLTLCPALYLPMTFYNWLTGEAHSCCYVTRQSLMEDVSNLKSLKSLCSDVVLPLSAFLFSGGDLRELADMTAAIGTSSGKKQEEHKGKALGKAKAKVKATEGRVCLEAIRRFPSLALRNRVLVSRLLPLPDCICCYQALTQLPTPSPKLNLSSSVEISGVEFEERKDLRKEGEDGDEGKAEAKIEVETEVCVDDELNSDWTDDFWEGGDDFELLSTPSHASLPSPSASTLASTWEALSTPSSSLFASSPLSLETSTSDKREILGKEEQQILGQSWRGSKVPWQGLEKMERKSRAKDTTQAIPVVQVARSLQCPNWHYAHSKCYIRHFEELSNKQGKSPSCPVCRTAVKTMEIQELRLPSFRFLSQ